MCARAEQKLSRRREREREWCVCVLGKHDLALLRQYRRFSETFRGKETLKGSAMLLSWQICASPFLQLQVGPRVKEKIGAALITLIKLVPLKGICVNALTLTALICNIYIYIWR